MSGVEVEAIDEVWWVIMVLVDGEQIAHMYRKDDEDMANHLAQLESLDPDHNVSLWKCSRSNKTVVSGG